MTKRVFVMQGVPGSGKSTRAKKIADAVEACDKTVVIVSADDFFVRLGGGTYAFDPSKISEAHKHCFRVFLRALAEDKDLVIVDNTNTSAIEIAPYMLAASSLGYDASIVRMRCAPDDAHARNTHGVPEAKVWDMNRQMMLEKLPPWWEVNEVDATPSRVPAL